MENHVKLLILQHPQEQDKSLGTARLTCLQLAQATLRIGLSWPNLAKALGSPADPERWAVLYLGSANVAELAPGRDIVFLNNKAKPLADQDFAWRGIEGLIVLDGSWSQAKALWWRNAWLLKCRRIVLAPKRPSRYGALRREPRREALSTIESAGQALAVLERRPEIETILTASFEQMLTQYRATHSAGPKRDRRSHRPRRHA